MEAEQHIASLKVKVTPASMRPSGRARRGRVVSSRELPVALVGGLLPLALLPDPTP